MILAACAAVLVAQESHAQGNYVILTTSNIVSVSTQLTNFVAAKTARGFQVDVVENTDTASGGWGGEQGDDAAENIKAWLVANYTNSSSEQIIDYVLLVGAWRINEHSRHHGSSPCTTA